MFDVTSRITYQNVPKWFQDIQRACGKLPCVMVGNKVDTKDRVLKGNQITWHRSRSIQYYDMSARSGYNFEKPFLYLARRLTNQPELRFVGEFASQPQLSAQVHGAAAFTLAQEQAAAQ